jgi:hypothetical protein
MFDGNSFYKLYQYFAEQLEDLHDKFQTSVEFQCAKFDGKANLMAKH